MEHLEKELINIADKVKYSCDNIIVAPNVANKVLSTEINRFRRADEHLEQLLTDQLLEQLVNAHRSYSEFTETLFNDGQEDPNHYINCYVKMPSSTSSASQAIAVIKIVDYMRGTEYIYANENATVGYFEDDEIAAFIESVVPLAEGSYVDFDAFRIALSKYNERGITGYIGIFNMGQTIITVDDVFEATTRSIIDNTSGYWYDIAKTIFLKATPVWKDSDAPVVFNFDSADLFDDDGHLYNYIYVSDDYYGRACDVLRRNGQLVINVSNYYVDYTLYQLQLHPAAYLFAEGRAPEMTITYYNPKTDEVESRQLAFSSME